MVAFISQPISKTTTERNKQAPGNNQEQISVTATEKTSDIPMTNTPENQKKKKRKKKSYKKRNRKSAPYQIISCAPTLSVSVIRIGNGNQVIFCVNNGNARIPGSVNFDYDSGFPRDIDNQRHFENANFPFKCSLYTPISYASNPFTNFPAKLNDFKIEIYQPGIWRISFKKD